MAVSPARAAAFDILRRVHERNSYAVELLHSTLLDALFPQDKSLVMEIVMGVLRWQISLDAEIARAAGRPLEKLDLEVLLAIRIALYQLAFLTRIPAHAAIHEGVELVKRAKKRSAAPFANAVLRKLSGTPFSLPEIPPRNISAESLSSSYSHPRWLVERWIAHYTSEVAAKICAYDQVVPQTVLRLPPGINDEDIRSLGLELEAGQLMTQARRVLSGDLSRLKSLPRKVFIQEEASQLVAALVPKGALILDCCAAPGGKAAALADGNPEGTVIATELHPHRARLMAQLAAAKNIEIVVADATALPFEQRFDCILADLPCSGTGTMARNPEIKARLVPADLEDLSSRQSGILRSAAAKLVSGGHLMFSTCSLEPEENERVLARLLQEDSALKIVDCRDHLHRLQKEGALLWPDIDSLLSGSSLRTIPGVHPCDGFFAALLRRE